MTPKIRGARNSAAAIPVKNVTTATPFKVGEPISDSNPLPVSKDSTGYNPGEPVSDSNPLPITETGEQTKVGTVLGIARRALLTASALVTPFKIGEPVSASNPLPVKGLAAPAPAKHRYWHLTITSVQNAGNIAAISELIGAETAGGPQLLTGATITSSPTQAGYTVSDLVDGNLGGSSGEAWITTNVAGVKTIRIDFGADAANWKAIAELRMHVNSAWHASGPKDYTWGWSDDGSTITTTMTVTGQTWSDALATTGIGLSRTTRSADCPDTLPGYLYYELDIYEANNTQVAIGELEFRGSAGGADLARAVVSSSVGPFFATTQAGSTNNASKPFDNTVAGGWIASTAIERIGTELPSRSVLAQVSIVPFPGFQGYAPKAFRIRGTNDPTRTTWTTLSTVINQTAWADSPTARLFAVP